MSIEEVKRNFENKHGSTSITTTRKGDASINDKRPMWDRAVTKTLQNGDTAILVPLFKEGLYSKVLPGKMVKFGFLNYIIAHKVSKDSIIFEWVELKPSEKWINAQKNRQYDGAIIIRTPEGRSKKIIVFNDGIVEYTGLKNFIKANNERMGQSVRPTVGINSREGDESPEDPGDPVDPIVCFANVYVYTQKAATTCPCAGHTYEQISQCDCATKPTPNRFEETIQVVAYECPTPVDPGPIGGGEGDPFEPGDFEGTGLMMPSDYAPLSCNPDPNYQMPTTPAPEGYDYIVPCSSMNVEPVDLPDPGSILSNAQTIVNFFNNHSIPELHLQEVEMDYLNNNPIETEKILNFLLTEDIEKIKQGRWLIAFLTANPEINFDAAKAEYIDTGALTDPNAEVSETPNTEFTYPAIANLTMEPIITTITGEKTIEPRTRTLYDVRPIVIVKNPISETIIPGYHITRYTKVMNACNEQNSGFIHCH